uniref:Odorant receptor n=1 Tax=Trichogramma kaykai TaxID=54128 RepID=A0ABD2XIF5_9HYME
MAYMKVLLDSIRKNWIKIVDKTERAILIQYSEKGFIISVGYMTYISLALIVYISTPLMPTLLDLVIPLNESRPKMHLLKGEFWFDGDEHYWQIFQIDSISCIMASTVVMTVDSFYANCTEHCLGLFAIVKYRLSIPNKENLKKTDPRYEDVSYKWLVENIRIHSAVLEFSSMLNYQIVHTT